MGHVWQRREDKVILVGVAGGLSASEIAINLGPSFTRNMVIGRHKRIRGIVSPCEQRAKNEGAARLAAQSELRSAVAAEATRRLSNGEDRNYLIRALRSRPGCSLNVLAAAFNLTREGIRYICRKQEAR